MNTALLCPDWPKCQQSINQATQLVVDVEGLPGEHVNKIANTLFDLAQGVNESWDELWEDGYKTIAQQQADVLVACSEIQKAVKLLVNIFRFRQAHENRAVIEARQRAAGSQKKKKRRLAPLPAQPSQHERFVSGLGRSGPAAPPIGATAHVITKDLYLEDEDDKSMIPSGIIDDHPIFIDKDVKEEPIDDDEPQFIEKVVKEEEFDEFAALKRPKSNDSVEITKTLPKSYAGYDEEEDEEEEEEEELIVSDDDDDDYHVPGQPTLRSTLKQFEPPAGLSIQKQASCDVCGQFTVTYFTTPKDPALKKICYGSLVDLTPKQAARVECLKLRASRAIVCESHYRKGPAETFASIREKREKANELLKRKNAKRADEHRWAANWQHEFHKAHPSKRVGLSRAAKSSGSLRPPALRDDKTAGSSKDPILCEDDEEL